MLPHTSRKWSGTMRVRQAPGRVLRVFRVVRVFWGVGFLGFYRVFGVLVFFFFFFRVFGLTAWGYKFCGLTLGALGFRA